MLDIKSTQNNKLDDMDAIRLLSIDQVCELLDMGRVKVYELIKRKQLKSVKIGARRLVRTTALLEFIERLEDSSV
jgi:excisionase family DNA binding protein